MQISIPGEALAQARTVGEAVRRASAWPAVRENIEFIAAKCGYRRYAAGSSWAASAAVEALSGFFASGGGMDRVEAAVREAAELGPDHSDLVDLLGRSSALSSLSQSVANAVRSRFPLARRKEVADRAAGALTDSVLRAVHRLDRSTPLDALRGTEVIVCYVPGLASCSGLEGTMTSHWTSESSSLTVKPDAAFMRFLALANVSVGEWLEAVAEEHGVDLMDSRLHGDRDWKAERTEAWMAACSAHDPCRTPITKPRRLVQAVDACYLGFTPLIAFTADAAEVCSRDWSAPMSVEGGILGLHDFVNGTGDPVRFEGKAVIDPVPADMALGEGMSNDFAEVHGFVRSSFRSRQADAPRDQVTSPSP